MKKIKINAGAVGTGKSRNWLNPIITTALSKNIPVLLVVPGLSLQSELKNLYPKAVTINNETDTSSVLSQIYKNFTTLPYDKSARMIIITHTAFQMLDYDHKVSNNDITLKYITENWLLAIDEAIESLYRSVPYYDSNLDVVERNKWLDSIMSFDTKFNKWIKVSIPTPTISILKESKTFQQLSHNSWETYISAEQLNKWTTSNSCIKLDFKQKFSTTVFQYWKEVYIAGENINNLEMGHWLSQDPNLNVIIEKEFVPLNSKITIHTTNTVLTQSQIKKDSYYSKESNYDQKFINQYYKETERVANGREMLVTRNTGYYSNKHKNEIQLKHNMHGINQYRNTHTIISFESTRNADDVTISFYNEIMKIDPLVLFDTRHTAVAHQLIGRTPARNENNEQEIDACIMDKKTVERLKEMYAGPNWKYKQLDVKSKREQKEMSDLEKIKEIRKEMETKAQEKIEQKLQKLQAKEQAKLDKKEAKLQKLQAKEQAKLDKKAAKPKAKTAAERMKEYRARQREIRGE